MSVKQFYFVLYTTCYLLFALSMHIPARLQKISSKFDRKHWCHPKLCGCEFNLAKRDHFAGTNQVVQKVLCGSLCKCYCTFCKYVHLPCLHINLVEVVASQREPQMRTSPNADVVVRTCGCLQHPCKRSKHPQQCKNTYPHLTTFTSVY